MASATSWELLTRNRKPSKWIERYATSHLATITVPCAFCGNNFATLKMRDFRKKCCSKSCAKSLAARSTRPSRIMDKAALLKSRTRVCVGCGVQFVRKSGLKNVARFHNRACSFAYYAAKAQARKARLLSVADARLTIRCTGCGARFRARTANQKWLCHLSEP